MSCEVVIGPSPRSSSAMGSGASCAAAAGAAASAAARARAAAECRLHGRIISDTPSMLAGPLGGACDRFDRKSVVTGESVLVGLDPGCLGIINKTQKNDNLAHN